MRRLTEEAVSIRQRASTYIKAAMTIRGQLLRQSMSRARSTERRIGID